MSETKKPDIAKGSLEFLNIHIYAERDVDAGPSGQVLEIRLRDGDSTHAMRITGREVSFLRHNLYRLFQALE